MDITRQAVTRHLQVLADAGLVHDSRAGRERLWEFEPARITEAQRSLEAIGRQWDVALEKLKLAVEQK
jgi:DNA-binding transcriptional ArsR family regulator